MKVGVLTGGGDCPGLNAVIRAVVRKGSFHYDDEFVGFLEGWRGVMEDKSMPSISSGGRHSAPRRHHSAYLAHQPFKKAGWSGQLHRHAQEAQNRCADRDRRRRHPVRGQKLLTKRRESGRCSQDHRQRPEPGRTTRLVSIRRSTSPPKPLTACTPQPKLTTA